MLIPKPDETTPRWGNAATRALGRFVLGLFGWRLSGDLPRSPRVVALAAPHTSYWDYVFGMAAIFALGIRMNYLAKHSAFKGPLGWFMRWTGGIPVNRQEPGDVLARAIQMLRESPRMWIGIAPEGTRKRVERWKTGYHRIATGAGVPIWPVALDYSTKTIAMLPLVTLSGELDADEAMLKALYGERMARYPEMFWGP
jgi:1-acyl-sn-glycerol-3-phosphate acyltransferase